MKLTDADIDRFEAGAKAATPGPWSHKYGQWTVFEDLGEDGLEAHSVEGDAIVVNEGDDNEHPIYMYPFPFNHTIVISIATDQHIARMDPPTVLAWVARDREQRTRIKALVRAIGLGFLGVMYWSRSAKYQQKELAKAKAEIERLESRYRHVGYTHEPHDECFCANDDPGCPDVHECQKVYVHAQTHRQRPPLLKGDRP